MPYIVLGILIAVVLIYLLCMEPHSQVFGRYPYRVATNKKVIALTFDDGPNEPYTSELLGFLVKEHIQATFFSVGDCLERHPGVAKRIVSDGHVIANHSESHRFRTYFKPSAFKKETEATQAVVQKQTGYLPALVRTPWLWRQPFVFRALKKLGLTPVGGIFCHPREVFGASAKQIADHAFRSAKPGTILIFHDGKEGVGGDRSQTIGAVKLLVPRLQQAGYNFQTVSELLGLEPYQN